MTHTNKGNVNMRFLDLEDAVKECEPLLDAKWELQKDSKDKDTGFIYYCKNISQVIDLAMSNEVDIAYSVHRWFNFVTSKMAEELFEQFGAKPEKDPKNHEIDFYLKDIAFDLKLTTMPQISDQNTLKTRKERNDLIKWLYKNQSQQSRKHNSNKIFIVCDAGNKHDSMMLKCNIEKLSEGISKFVSYYNKKDFNTVKIDEKTVFSDIIYIKI